VSFGIGQLLLKRTKAAGDLLANGRIAHIQDVAQIGKRGRCAIAEDRGLLDLQIDGDLFALDAARVLHRNQAQKAQQLAGAARLLGRAQRCGAKAAQQPIDLRQLAGDGLPCAGAIA
jgi:hypothetical protein